jgi:hypothetical protein
VDPYSLRSGDYVLHKLGIGRFVVFRCFGILFNCSLQRLVDVDLGFYFFPHFGSLSESEI